MMFTPGISPWQKVSQIFRSLGFWMMANPQWRPAQIEGLAGSHERHGLVGHFRTEGCNGNMAVPGIKQITMDLVRADDQMMAKTDLGNLSNSFLV